MSQTMSQMMPLISPKKKLNILFQGWIYIPHSYATVLCFQLVSLYKNYKDEVNFYIQEMPYYNPEWVRQELKYSQEYNEILNNKEIFKEYTDDVKLDLIYRITFPYNITIADSNIDIPKIVFFTSEFRTLEDYYFKVQYPSNDLPINEKNKYLEDYIHEAPNLYFTCPSAWSRIGLERYIGKDSPRNRIITHGVSSDIFKPDRSKRLEIRTKFGITENDVLLINIGSMTSNKGIVIILQVLNHIVNVMKLTEYKLILKGTKDLYKSQDMLNQYIAMLGISEEFKINLFKYIIYLDNTLTYSEINDLFNASDIYMSPYLAEGFNLTVIEALGSSLNVLVPITGSTKEYIEDINRNGGSEFIYAISSEVIQEGTNRFINKINIDEILRILILQKDHIKKIKDPTKMLSFIEKEYSWSNVSKLIMTYVHDILDNRI
jgi:glycosyltransferase involved in cell wall biosynthesis